MLAFFSATKPSWRSVWAGVACACAAMQIQGEGDAAPCGPFSAAIGSYAEATCRGASNRAYACIGPLMSADPMRGVVVHAFRRLTAC